MTIGSSVRANCINRVLTDMNPIISRIMLRWEATGWLNTKNYFSYNVSLRSIPTNSQKEGNGILMREADTIDYVSVNNSKTLSLVNVYNLYHRLMFEGNSSLENQMNFHV